MDAQKENSEHKSSSSAPEPALGYCRKGSTDGTFMAYMMDCFDEFLHSSMDEHKACFKSTFQKITDQAKEMLGMEKIDGEKPSSSQ